MGGWVSDVGVIVHALEIDPYITDPATHLPERRAGHHPVRGGRPKQDSQAIRGCSRAEMDQVVADKVIGKNLVDKIRGACVQLAIDENLSEDWFSSIRFANRVVSNLHRRFLRGRLPSIECTGFGMGA